MKITGKNLFWMLAVILTSLFSAGCNVADPDPNAVWLDLEFFHAKYPFMHYTGVLRQITEYGKANGVHFPLNILMNSSKKDINKVYYYKAALSLFASTDGKEWQPVKFYHLSYGFPPKRNESYYSPDTYSCGFDGFESWESHPVLDFGRKDTIYLKVMVRPHDKNLPEKYCVIQLKRPREKRSPGDKYLLFLNFGPRYPYQKVSLPPWEDWKVAE